MKIIDIQISACKQVLSDPSWKFARANLAHVEGNIVKITDEDGCQGHGYMHSIPAISTTCNAAVAALQWMKEFLLSREIESISAVMNEMDVMLHGSVTVKGAIDFALHDLVSKKNKIHLTALIGGKKRNSVHQSRIIPIKSPLEMAFIAGSLAESGYKTLKLKMNGNAEEDFNRVKEVRSAVGSQIKITLDPNQAYGCKGFIRLFSKIEDFSISLVEQPLKAHDWRGLQHLTNSLPVDIEADESAQSLEDVFNLVNERVVDVINLKLTKMGGFINFMRAVNICEAAGVGCRIGAMFGPSLLQAAGAHAASTISANDHASETSEHLHLLDDPFTGLEVVDGTVLVPRGFGMGVVLKK